MTLQTVSDNITMCCVEDDLKNDRKECNYLKHKGIETVIISNEKECIEQIHKILSFKPMMVGISLKSRYLLQIGHKKLILLIRLHKLLNNFPSIFLSFLNNGNILKVGVGIYGKAHEMKKNYQLLIRGCVDINDVHRNWAKYIDLSELCCAAVNKRTGRKQKWHCEKLTYLQIHRAADEVLMAFELFIEITKNYIIKSSNVDITQKMNQAIINKEIIMVASEKCGMLFWLIFFSFSTKKYISHSKVLLNVDKYWHLLSFTNSSLISLETLSPSKKNDAMLKYLEECQKLFGKYSMFFIRFYYMLYFSKYNISIEISLIFCKNYIFHLRMKSIWM